MEVGLGVNMDVGMDVGIEVTTEVAMDVTTEVKRLLKAIKKEMTRQELQQRMGLKNAEHFRKSYLIPAIAQGVVERTIPEKPNSRLQKYRLTEKGLQMRRYGKLR